MAFDVTLSTAVKVPLAAGAAVLVVSVRVVLSWATVRVLGVADATVVVI